MVNGEPLVIAEVLADGDVLRGERLARSLRAELNEVEHVTAEFAQGRSPGDLAKGFEAAGDAALWIFLGVTVKAGARVAVEVVKAWSAKEKHRRVRLTFEGRQVEIDGSASAAELALIGEFLRDGRA